MLDVGSPVFCIYLAHVSAMPSSERVSSVMACFCFAASSPTIEPFTSSLCVVTSSLA